MNYDDFVTSVVLEEDLKEKSKKKKKLIYDILFTEYDNIFKLKRGLSGLIINDLFFVFLYK